MWVFEESNILNALQIEIIDDLRLFLLDVGLLSFSCLFTWHKNALKNPVKSQLFKFLEY